VRHCLLAKQCRRTIGLSTPSRPVLAFRFCVGFRFLLAHSHAHCLASKQCHTARLPNSPPAAIPLPEKFPCLYPRLRSLRQLMFKTTCPPNPPIEAPAHFVRMNTPRSAGSGKISVLPLLVRAIVQHRQFRVPRPCQLVRRDRIPAFALILSLIRGCSKKPLDFSCPLDNIVSVYACIISRQSTPSQTHEFITHQVSQKYPKTARNNVNNAN